MFTQTVSFKQETHGTIAGHAAAVATTLCHMPRTPHLPECVLLTPSSLPCRRLAGQGEDLPRPADRSRICHRTIQIAETWRTRLQKLGKYSFTPSTLKSELLEDSCKTVLLRCCQEGWTRGGERRVMSWFPWPYLINQICQLDSTGSFLYFIWASRLLGTSEIISSLLSVNQTQTYLV